MQVTCACGADADMVLTLTERGVRTGMVLKLTNRPTCHACAETIWRVFGHERSQPLTPIAAELVKARG